MIKIKRFYISVFIIIVVFFAAFVINRVYLNKVNDLIESIDNLSQTFKENPSEILRNAQSFSDLWKDSKVFFACFLPTDVFEDTDQSVEMLLIFAKNGEFDTFQQTISEIRCKIFDLLQFEELNPKNIF